MCEHACKRTSPSHVVYLFVCLRRCESSHLFMYQTPCLAVCRALQRHASNQLQYISAHPMIFKVFSFLNSFYKCICQLQWLEEYVIANQAIDYLIFSELSLS